MLAQGFGALLLVGIPRAQTGEAVVNGILRKDFGRDSPLGQIVAKRLLKRIQTQHWPEVSYVSLIDV